MPADRPTYAFVATEPTPYRLHLLQRLVSEIPEAKLLTIFLTGPDESSMAWSLDLPPQIHPVVYPECGRKRGRSNHNEQALCRAVQKTLEEHDARLVINMGWIGPAERSVIAWGGKRGVPVIVRGDFNVHAVARTGSLGDRVREALRGWRVRWVARQAAGLMPMGSCGHDYFQHYAPGHGKPEFLCPYEPDYALFERDDAAVAEFCAAHRLDPHRKRLLYCGRLVDVKRVDVLIDAFARVHADHPEWDIVVCGDGPLRDSLQSQATARDVPPQRIHWLGFFSDMKQVRLAYHASDVLVLPSGSEPWALVINEAVASGLAVVATTVVGAAAELVQQGVNGHRVPPGDVNALAAALGRVMAPGAAARMGAAAFCRDLMRDSRLPAVCAPGHAQGTLMEP